MTVDQLRLATMSTPDNAKRFLDHIIAACKLYDISTPVRQLCFLSQLGHESGGLFYTEELASGTAYEGRADLGNTQPGDGVRFKGRGLIQITGRNNYKLVSDALHTDFITTPSLLGGKNANLCSPDQLKHAAMSAGWFWNNCKLNTIADKIDLKAPIDAGVNNDNYKLITRKINGGYNGLADRIMRYKSGAKSFGAV